LFNLRGLAHKVVLETDFFWADANQDLAALPLYDPLDDDSQLHFRRWIANTRPEFDARYYALRTGMQNWVASPLVEIADDLAMSRIAVRQRWQTKRGLPGQERIIDWIALDLAGSLFPKSGRDNFGEDVGLLDYDFRWRLGDRLTVLSDGFIDVFGDGLRTFAVGGELSRPEQGDVFVQFRTVDGPITSNVLGASVSYRTTEKWILTAGASMNFSSNGNTSVNIGLIRIGESMLVRVGAYADQSRDNLGVQLAVEPRFLPTSRLGRVGGVQIPPAGARGLE
jgi:hypothetical protein